MKKSRTSGVKIESLKLPSVVDFAVGELVVKADFCPFIHMHPLPPTTHTTTHTCMHTESTRSHDWDSVVSCHAGHSSAQTWNLQKCVIGRHSLTSRHVDSGARPVVSYMYENVYTTNIVGP